MSVFLEILKFILCCEDEYIDISDNETSFWNIFSRTSRVSTHSSSIDESYSATRTSNYPQHYSNSSLSSPLINSTRNKSTGQSQPSDVPVEYRVVLGSETNNPTSNRSLYLKSFERVYQGPQNSRSSDTYNIYSSSTSTKTELILSHASSKPSPSFTTPAASTLKPSSSFPEPSASSKPSPSSTKPPTRSKPSIRSPKPSSSSSKSSSSSSKPSLSYSNPLPFLRPTLSLVLSNLTDQQEKGKYIRADPKDTLPIFKIPQDIEDLFKRDIVPEILKKPLSPSTYQDYFAALLYAEDYHIKNGSNFELVNVPLELHPASKDQKSGRNMYSKASNKKDNKTFVVFKVDSVPMKRSFLLSRDFFFAQPSDKKVEPFQGSISRVGGTTILAEFGKKFHSQHDSAHRYNISFSFNRVGLKRCHQAIAATSAPLLQHFIFPYSVSQDLMPIATSFNLYNHGLHQDGKSAVHRIMNCRGSPPFLVKGPLCVSFSKQLSITGLVIKEAVLQIYQRHPGSKILVGAVKNSTCDMLMTSLEMEIPVSDMFRANAKFRDISEPEDILLSCLYERESDRHTFPPIHELRDFRVIFSTFISSYRLCNAGISAGHFSHIFLVDASSATEPDTMVVVANLADESTTVIVTGQPGNCPHYVRSDIAWENGLRTSYFERLCEFGPYKNGNSMLTAQLDKSDSRKVSDSSFLSGYLI